MGAKRGPAGVGAVTCQPQAWSLRHFAQPEALLSASQGVAEWLQCDKLDPLLPDLCVGRSR